MNSELFKHLDDIANLKALDGANQFSIASYQRAAKAVRDSVKELSADDVADFPGVGKKIALTAAEFLSTGTSSTYKELVKKVPVECLTLTAVQGIGAKKAFKLYKFGIKSFEELVKRAEQDKLEDIISAKIGVRTVGEFKQAILFARDTKAGRMPYATARAIADAILEPLNKLDWTTQVDVLGSLRRKKETIKDVDIGVCAEKANHSKAFRQIFKALDEASIDYEVANQGSTKSSLRIRHFGATIGCDIWLVEPWYWGSFLNYATGSKQHNISLRSLAQQKGLTISEYGIFEIGTKTKFKINKTEEGRVTFVKGIGVRLGGENEEDLYRVLGLEYVEPEKRED